MQPIHPQLLHVLAGLSDSLADISPSCPSLDHAASRIIATELRHEANELSARAALRPELRAELDAALPGLALAEDAVTAAHEQLVTALRRISHANMAARLNQSPDEADVTV